MAADTLNGQLRVDSMDKGRTLVASPQTSATARGHVASHASARTSDASGFTPDSSRRREYGREEARLR